MVFVVVRVIVYSSRQSYGGARQKGREQKRLLAVCVVGVLAFMFV